MLTLLRIKSDLDAINLALLIRTIFSVFLATEGPKAANLGGRTMYVIVNFLLNYGNVGPPYMYIGPTV